MAMNSYKQYYGLINSKSSISSIFNSLFMSTVNVAAKTLVSTASNVKNQYSPYQKWNLSDHIRYLRMLLTWLTLWFFRVLMDTFPSFLGFNGPKRLLDRFSRVRSLENPRLPLLLPPSSKSFSSASMMSASSSLVALSTSLDLVPYDGVGGPSVEGLGRALSQIFVLLNEMPATSRKYQFALAMADKIMQDNAKDFHVDLLDINRTALSSAFARTCSLLQQALQRTKSEQDYAIAEAWPARVIQALPLGHYVAPYVRILGFCLNAVMSAVAKTDTWMLPKKIVLGIGGGGGGEVEEYSGEVMAEKLAQELMWMTEKLREYRAIGEAMEQWSFASELASLSLTTSPRLQGSFVKITAILFCELTREGVEVSREVKFRLLLLWLPLLCHASNGLAYPILSAFEKAELERAVNQVIGSLPSTDQEVILTNWLQDFAISASDWPNLQPSYDRWCHFTRELVP